MKKRYDAVFVYINVINGYISGAEYQLECAYMRAYLGRQGLETLQYINKNANRYKDMVKELQDLNCKNYIFYINEYNYYVSRLVINGLKSFTSGKTVFVVGPSAKYISANLMEELDTDVCVNNHEAFVLWDILCGNKPLEDVNDVTLKIDGVIHRSASANPDYSLDQLGVPYSDGVIPPEEIQNVGMVTSTGCYGKCSFCSYNLHAENFKTHSIGSVMKELEYVHSYIKGNHVVLRFFDDCFSVTGERTLELCKEIITKKFKFQFWCCTRADLLTPEIIDAMAECNFRNIVIGLETASETVLEKLGKMRKKDTAFDYIKRVRERYQYAADAKKMNPLLSINFGLPFEKLPDAMETIKFVTDNKAEVSVCYMTSFPGSRIFENSDEYGVVKEPSPTILPFRTYYSSYDMGKVMGNLNATGIMDNSKLQFITNTNGYLREFYTFHTGIYSESELYGSLKHIGIDVLNNEEINFIDQNICLNGTVFDYKDTLTIRSKSLFCDDRKRLKIAIKEYDSNLKMAFESGKYLPKQVFIKNNPRAAFLQMDNLFAKKPLEIKIRKINVFSELYNIGQKAEELFHNNYIHVEDLAKGMVENACCLSGECRLCSVPRARIREGRVFACHDRGEIGNIENTYEELLRNAGSLKETAEKDRGCTNCEAKEWCPRCAVLPEFLSVEQYCSFMKKNENAGIYIKLLNLLCRSINLSTYPGENIEVYTAKKYKNHVNSVNRYKFKDEVAIVKYIDLYYLCNLENGAVTLCSTLEKDIVLDMMGVTDKKVYSPWEYNKIINKFKLNQYV